MALNAFAFANVAASSTDTVLIQGIADRVILIKGLVMQCGATATDVTFNTKTLTVGTAISAKFQLGINGTSVFPFSDSGLMKMVPGNSLSVTTSAGSTVGIQLIYEYIGITGSYTPATPKWTFTGSLNSVRSNYAIVKLSNGKPMIIGGDAVAGTSGPYKTCELFDPALNTWALTGAMSTFRSWSAALKLNNGQVLAFTGTTDEGTTFPVNTELYDPVAGTWSATTGDMTQGRLGCAFWLLSNGKVLVSGGDHGSGIANDLNSSELYDPATKTWSATGSLVGNAVLFSGGPFAYKPRFPLFGTLSDGRPIIVGGTINGGGQACSNCQTYDVNTGLWTARANAPDFISGIMVNCATTMANGNFITVGSDFDQSPNIRKTCFIYSPSSDSWVRTGDLPFASEGSQVWLGNNGTVYQAGGSTDEANGAVVFSASFSEPNWNGTPPLNTARSWTTRNAGVVLDDGRLILPGGLTTGSFNSIGTCEVFG